MQRYRFLFVLTFLLTTWLVSCSLGTEDLVEIPTLIPTQDATQVVAAVAAPHGAETVGLTFYKAWELRNYAEMYRWLSPRTQGLVREEDFIQRYEEAMDTVRVIDVAVQPQAVAYEGSSAEMTMRVIWKTAVVGDVIRDHTVPLIYENERWGVVWDESLIMPELSGGNYLRLDIQTPPRGDLLDRGDKKLSFQGSGVILGVLPMNLEDEAGFLQTMAALFGTNSADLKALYADVPDNWFVPFGTISENVLQANYYAIEPYVEKGLQLRRGAGRIYNPENTAPHLIGYMGYIPESQRTEYWSLGYRADERIGVTGLEQAAEQYLAGTRGGQLSLISPSGEKLTVLEEVAAQQGRDVHATFDSEFQNAVQQALEEAIVSYGTGQAGAVVVLDVNTGAVRAMASYPSFDISAFSEIRDDSLNILQALLDDPRRPLYNRASQGEYPPGSTFKIVTSSSGLASGLFNGDTTYYCTGIWDEAGQNLLKYDWLEGGHGNVTLSQGLTRSCNPYMYHIGLALENANQFALPNMARSFGLGAATQILGAPESTGAIPDPEWILETYGAGWSPGDTINMAIGQGYVLATPLQIANMTAAVANGGALYRPNLIERIAAASGAPEQLTQPELIGEVLLSPEHMRIVQDSMNDVTSDIWGTATDKFTGFDVSTAGKTGTAQTPGENSLPHAWFTGYSPADIPEIAITVLVENAGEGSAVAAPIFRRVAELYFGREPTRYPWQVQN